MTFGFGLGLTRGGGAGGLIPAFNANLLSGSLPQGATFSRGTIATQYNSSGLLQYAPSNLYLYSSDLNNVVYWNNPASNKTTGQIAPDGSSTAVLFTPTAAVTTHNFIQVLSLTGTYTASIYAKAGGYSTVFIANGTQTSGGNFNLATGTASSVGSAPVAITSVGNGWYRLSTTIVLTAESPYFFINSMATYAGNGSGVYFWGGQIEASPAVTTYTPTTTAAVYAPRFDYDPNPANYTQQNLLLQSNAFTTSPWALGGGPTVTANATVAPDGTNTAWYLATSSTNILQPVIISANLTYVYSIYAKYVNSTTIGGETNGANIGTWSFNLLTGVQNSVSGTCSSVSGTAVGNGWYRISVTMVMTGSGSTNFYQYGGTGFNQAGVSYIWGAQVNIGSTALPYLATTTAAQTIAAPKGLLIEEPRTNSLLSSQDFTTTWTPTNTTASLASTVLAPDSISSSSLLTNTATNGHVDQIIAGWGTTNPISYSVYAKAGTATSVTLRFFNGINGAQCIFDLSALTGTTSQLGGTYGTLSYTIQNVGNGWYRLTLLASLTGFASLTFQVYNWGASGTTAYFWGAQAEAGAFATSYLPTTAATVTRNADVVTIPSASYAGWFNQSAGTFYVSFDAATTALSIVGDGNGSGSGILYSSVGDIKTYNGTTGFATTNLFTANTVAKSAISYSATGRVGILNGSLAGLQSVAGTLQTITSIQLGFGFNNSYLNGHIRSFQYYNYAFTNAQLQAITT